MNTPVKVAADITWDLIKKYDVYSCPDRPKFDFVKGARALLLSSKKLTETVLRYVDSEVSLNAADPELALVEPGLHTRLLAYIAEAKERPGILDNACRYHRFCFLQPDWLRQSEKSDSLETTAVQILWQENETWFRWPTESKLLRRGWTRHSDGKRNDCYSYDAELIQRLNQKNLEPDGRNNGPAILSFRMAGGDRPCSCGEGWPIHHIYDGQAFIPGDQQTILHAVQDGDHFTHSGGLVALHPAAHFIAHESELLGWLLRWEAYRRFEYDPDNIFSLP
jgi:hypothetical protein